MANRYEVIAEMTTRLKVEIIADSEEEALLKAKLIDGGDFSEIEGSGSWHIESANLKEKNIEYEGWMDDEIGTLLEELKAEHDIADPQKLEEHLYSYPNDYPDCTIEDVRGFAIEHLDEYLSSLPSESLELNFVSLMNRIGGDWGVAGFHDMQSGKFIRISVTYDHDCVWDVFDSSNVNYDEEINQIEIIGSKEPLLHGYFDPNLEYKEQEPNPDEEIEVWNKHLAEVLVRARSII